MRTAYETSWGERLEIHHVPVLRGRRFRVESKVHPEIAVEADGVTPEDAIRELTIRLSEACERMWERKRREEK